MDTAINNLQNAFKKAMSIRPKVGGFPVLAEVLRQAGVKRNVWSLPSCQSIYFTEKGVVVTQNEYVVSGNSLVPSFNQEKLVAAIRADQMGTTTFAEFLQASWNAGVVEYEVNLDERYVVYRGVFGESYTEEYPYAEI